MGHVEVEALCLTDSDQNLFYGKALILRYIEVLDVLALDMFLLSTKKVLQKTMRMLAKNENTY